MAAPTPIHRDPDADGDDYGCVGRDAAKANRAVASLVSEVCRRLAAGGFGKSDRVLEFVRARLEEIESEHDCGCCDTLVKENVFAAVHDAVTNAGLKPIDQRAIYGW